MAAAIASAIASASEGAAASACGAGVARSPLAAFLFRRLFSAGSSPAGAAPLTGLARDRLAPSAVPLSHAVCVLASPGASRLHQVRCRVHRSGDPAYSPPKSGSGSGSSDRPPTEMAPLLPPGMDFEHWIIVMDKPGGKGATEQQMIDRYIQTLAKVVGSEEEAKKKIYNVYCGCDFGFGCEIDEDECDFGYGCNYCECDFGFGCEIDEETSNKLEGLPGVHSVLPDCYVDAAYKDYGAELLVNGEVVQRSPERQRRVENAIQSSVQAYQTRYNDRTRNARRREKPVTSNC